MSTTTMETINDDKEQSQTKRHTKGTKTIAMMTMATASNSDKQNTKCDKKQQQQPSQA